MSSGALLLILILLATGLLLGMFAGRRARRLPMLRFCRAFLLAAGGAWAVALVNLVIPIFIESGFGWRLLLLMVLAAALGIVLWREQSRLRSITRKAGPHATGSPAKNRPKLLWPFAAILGPMLVLAVMAAWTLRADRRSVEQEARTRATELATTMLAAAERILNVVEPGTNGFRVAQGCDSFIVNDRFELTDPQPWTWPPTPAPLGDRDLAELTAQELAQWREAEAALNNAEWAKAAELYGELVTSHPQSSKEPAKTLRVDTRSGRLGSLALFRRAIALERLGHTNQAVTAYDEMLDGLTRGQSDLGESGLLLRHVAILKILDLTGGGAGGLPVGWRPHPTRVVNLVCDSPASPLAEEAIRRLRLCAELADENPPPEKLFDGWERAARGRQCYAEAAATMADATNGWPDCFWVGPPRQSWLAIRHPLSSKAPNSGRSYLFAALSEVSLLGQVHALFQREFRDSPFAAILEISGRNHVLIQSPVVVGSPGHRVSMSQRMEAGPMAAAQSSLWPARVSVTLKDPERYYASVRRRQFILGGLVALALAAGLAAAWTLRHSLLRQLRLNEMKSNFVSSVSHELRAPIASVRLLAESLERGKIAEPAKQGEYFRFIGQECRRLSSLIENVLDFSRIEQGHKQYEFEPTDIVALVRETVKLLEPYAVERGVVLKSEIRNPKSEIEMDGRAIQQALVNLIDNAIKHSPKGETVIVELLDATRHTPHAPTLNPQPSTLNLSVSDRGPGIPVSEREKIFERFYRLGSELRRETRGVGIGLSIVKHIVEAHGGRLRVESEMGQGSRFTIELPLAGKQNS